MHPIKEPEESLVKPLSEPDGNHISFAYARPAKSSSSWATNSTLAFAGSFSNPPKTAASKR
jgi:hypothetical protein